MGKHQGGVAPADSNMPHALEDFRENQREWKTSMLNAPCADPCYFCYGCLCPWCAVYQQRDAMIEASPHKKYVCCMGYCCLTMELPKIPCLCCEVCCCLGLAASFNRIHVMQKFRIKVDPCDECIICCSNVMQILACLAQFVCEPEQAEMLQNIADLVFYIVLGCMNTQVYHEIKEGEGGVWPAASRSGMRGEKQPMMR